MIFILSYILDYASWVGLISYVIAIWGDVFQAIDSIFFTIHSMN